MPSINIVLLIIELLFLVDGLWAIIFGKLPVGLFNYVFGQGEYKFPPNQTRLFGLFLSSPIPISYLVSLLLTELFGAKGTQYAIIFEIIYLLTIMITSIIIVRNASHVKTKKKR